MTHNIPRLREALATKPFVTTIEFNPPKGTDASKVMTLAGKMVGMVDGVNVTDNTAGVACRLDLTVSIVVRNWS